MNYNRKTGYFFINHFFFLFTVFFFLYSLHRRYLDRHIISCVFVMCCSFYFICIFCTSAPLTSCTLGRVALFVSLRLISCSFIILVFQFVSCFDKDFAKEINIKVNKCQCCRVQHLRVQHLCIYLTMNVCIKSLHSAPLLSKANAFLLVYMLLRIRFISSDLHF